MPNFDTSKTKNEIEVSALLDTLMYLDADFMNGSFKYHSVYEIVSKLSEKYPPPQDEKLHSSFKTIKAIVEGNRDTYDKIILNSTSYSEGYELTDLIAASFTGPENEVYIAFRGTGDGKWLANADGIIENGSELQGKALDYVTAILDNYHSGASNVTVTGHSQGGNLAQYVTMFLGDKIDNCYSFDGQGHSASTIESFKDYCAANGLDYNAIISKMYSINGENDYVHDLGIAIIPDSATFFIKTPEARSLDGFHDIALMFDGQGLNWTYSQDGTIIQGEQQAIGKLAKLLSETMAGMDHDTMSACAYSIMSLIETYMPYKESSFYNMYKDFVNFQRGTVGTDYVTPEQWRVFLENGVPAILETLKNNPDLVQEAVIFLWPDMAGKLSLTQVQGLLNILASIYDHIPTNSLEVITSQLVFGDTGNIDWIPTIAAILSIFPSIRATMPTITDDLIALLPIPDDLKSILTLAADIITAIVPMDTSAHLIGHLSNIISKGIKGELSSSDLINSIVDFALTFIPWGAVVKVVQIVLKWIEDNPELSQKLIKTILKFSFPVISILPEWALDSITTAIVDFISLLPKDWSEFVDLFVAIEAVVASFLKQIVTIAWNAIKTRAKELIVKINGLVVGAVEGVNAYINEFIDFSSKIADTTLNIITNVTHVAEQFIRDTLSFFKAIVPEAFTPVINLVQDAVGLISSIVAQCAEMCKNLINSIKEGLKTFADKVASGIVKAVDAVTGFAESMTGLLDNTINAVIGTVIDSQMKFTQAKKGLEEVTGLINNTSALLATLTNAFRKALDKLREITANFFANSEWDFSSPENLLDTLANWSFKCVSSTGAENYSSGRTAISTSSSDNQVAYTMPDLRQLQTSVRDIAASWQGLFRFLSGLSSAIMSASSKYNQGYVHSAASAATSALQSINTQQNDIFRELQRLESSLMEIVNGYAELETRFR